MEIRLAEFLERWLGAGFLVPDYGLMFSIAILLGLSVTVRNAKRGNFDSFTAFRVAVTTIVAAFIGARLFVVVENASYYAQRPFEVFYYWQDGLASSGAYIGGMLAAIVMCWWVRLPTGKFLDCCAPAIALAICIGRIGCFLHGCCYGKHSDLPWSVRFPPGTEPNYQQLLNGTISPHELSFPLHPTQLYEALFGLAIFGFLIRYRKRERRDGELIALLFLIYSFGRFVIEFLRDDYRPSAFGISLPQYVTVVAALLATVFLIAMRVRKHFPVQRYLRASVNDLIDGKSETRVQPVG